MPARRIAAHASELRSRRDTHAAEERLERDDDARRELRGHLLRVDRNDARRDLAVAVLRQDAAAAVVAVIDVEADRENLYLEHVARLRALDEDRSGENVPAGAAAIAGHLGHDGFERRLNLVAGHARTLQPGRA